MAKIVGAQIPEEIKNLAINGNFDFWQRVETAVTTINATGSTNYTADMIFSGSTGTTTKNYSIQQSSNVPSLTQSGFESNLSYLFTMVTGISSPATGDFVIPFEYRMEGFDYQRIHSKLVTFGFWVYATVAGTYNFSLGNLGGTRSYVTTFNVSGSNTWQFVSLSIVLDSSGTWNFNNTAGLIVYIGAVAGSTYQTATTNTWTNGALLTTAGSTNWQATTGAVLQIAQFSIVEGPLGFSATGFQRAGKSIQQELAMCQRYYEKSYDIGTAVGAVTTNGYSWKVADATTTIVNYVVVFRVYKRVAPTFTTWNPNTGASGSAWNFSTSASLTTAVNNAGMGAASFNSSGSVSATQNCGAHWTAEAGL